MIYNVNIEETINGVFKIEANSKEEAFDIARKKYYDGLFVNEPGEVTSVKAAISSLNNDFDGWEEF